MKKFLFTLLILGLLLSNPEKIKATSENKEPINDIVLLKNINYSKLNEFEDLETNIVPYFSMDYGYMEKSELLSTHRKTFTVTPSGQPDEGYRASGSVFVNTSGGPRITVGMSVPTQYVSFSISVGYTARNNIGGVLVNLPNNKNFYKIKVDKEYQVRVLKVKQYKYGTYQGYYYAHPHNLMSEDYYAVRVK